MRTQLSSALKSAIPITLLASPLLMGASQPTAVDSVAVNFMAAEPVAAYPTERSPYGTNCNAETYEAAQVANRGRGQSVDVIAHPAGTSPQAIVTSEQELSAVAQRLNVPRERLYNAVRRLLLSNPYSSDSMDSEQAENNCIALSNPEFLIAQIDDPLPILGPVNGGSFESPVVPSVPVVRPTVTPAERPAIAPATPSRLPSPQIAPTIAPSGASVSVDPTNITPTNVNPTPFDGIPISTLASRPDGNYRYVAGAVENRAYSDAELQQQSRAVFVLKKDGNRIVGELTPRFGESSSVCITGIVSGDSISGSAYAQADDDKLSASTLVASAPAGALQLQSTGSMSEVSAPIGAVLDLSSFSMINAGSALPPKSCEG